MKEIQGNLWDYAGENWVVITTNGSIKKNGHAVMGRGVALEAAVLYPTLPDELGTFLRNYGNHIFMFGDYKLLTLPVKHRWFEKADPDLIEQGLIELATMKQENDGWLSDNIYMTRPGCGNGGLDWVYVRPLLQYYLDDSFIVVQN